MKFRKTIGIAAAALTLGVIGAPQAMAADEWMYTDDSNPGAGVEFTAYGDVFKLCDVDNADGYGVELRVFDTTINEGEFLVENKNGSGCKTYRASMGSKYDLHEGSLLSVTICLLDGTVSKYCDDALWMNEN